MAKTSKKPKTTISDAERIKNCGEDLTKLLKKHQCAFDISVLLTAQGNVPMMKIVILPPESQS